MPAIWTFPASCSMVQSASSPLPWLDLSPDWPRLRATLQAGRLGLRLVALPCLSGWRPGQPQIDELPKQVEPEWTPLHGGERGNDQTQGLQPPVPGIVRGASVGTVVEI
jgi:hypothetical protein